MDKHDLASHPKPSLNANDRIAQSRLSVNTVKHNPRIQNFMATFVILATVYVFYAVVPYFQTYFSTNYEVLGARFSQWNALQVFSAVYLLLLAMFYFTEREPGVSKSIHCLRAMKRIAFQPMVIVKGGLSVEERVGVLTILLKAFFAPLMVAWLVDHTLGMVINGSYVFRHLWLLRLDFLLIFNSHLFWFLFKVILFLDVFFFTIGYLVELKVLKNEIRSVDPTLLGWVVALACYPPFNSLTGIVLSAPMVNFPQFESAYIHIVLNLFLLILMAIFTSASVALNFKASNLTHRGIIDAGPYHFVRHPAYVCKNLAWWIGAVPVFLSSLHDSLWTAFLVLMSVAGWSLIYAFRALTEEDHLNSVDGEYAEYCKKVPYRFIPGVI